MVAGMNVRAVGEYIRNQRVSSRLSLKKMSGLAGVSIPYLSQVERGLRKPSADILQAIAKGLRISAETLYVQAGMLEDRAVPDVASAIMADPTINERQKQALVQIYQAFRDETRVSAEPAHGSDSKEKASARAETAQAARAPARSRGRSGGGAESSAATSRRPAPLRSSASKRRKEV